MINQVVTSWQSRHFPDCLRIKCPEYDGNSSELQDEFPSLGETWGMSQYCLSVISSFFPKVKIYLSISIRSIRPLVTMLTSCLHADPSVVILIQRCQPLDTKNQTEFPKESDFQEKNQIFTKTQTITSIARQDCSVTADSTKFPPTLTPCPMLW